MTACMCMHTLGLTFIDVACIRAVADPGFMKGGDQCIPVGGSGGMLMELRPYYKTAKPRVTSVAHAWLVNPRWMVIQYSVTVYVSVCACLSVTNLAPTLLISTFKMLSFCQFFMILM